MPTYYSCGFEYSEDPYDEDVHLDYDCGCSEDDRDCAAPADGGAAARAAQAVNALGDAKLPDMRVDVARQVSCEWEGTRGVRTANIALDYLLAGIQHEYHGDITCDGEVVFGRMELWKSAQAVAYARSLATIAELRSTGDVRVGLRAGHHVHVSAREYGEGTGPYGGQGMSANGLVAIYSIFAHCEDLLYRFAAAGWSQHRCEVDSSYSNPMIKLRAGTMRTPRHVGNAIGGDRYQGLNVTPYLDAIQRCRCGAYRFGEWESCECMDDRMTIEWRLWNAAVSPRKIRAYIAISAVLTDYAAKVDSREVVGLDEHPFEGTGNVDEDSLAGQLDYLVTRPGFSARDVEDIRWLAAISPGMGDVGRDNAQYSFSSERLEMATL